MIVSLVGGSVADAPTRDIRVAGNLPRTLAGGPQWRCAGNRWQNYYIPCHQGYPLRQEGSWGQRGGVRPQRLKFIIVVPITLENCPELPSYEGPAGGGVSGMVVGPLGPEQYAMA